MSDIEPLERYQLMIQSIVPRPVAWTLTRNESGNFNLAPFSYFNAVHSQPPLIMMSVGNKRDKTQKDTRVNIEREKSFVIHIASGSDAEKVTASSLAFDYGDSEIERGGHKLVDSWDFPLPRLEGSKIAFGCSLERVIELGGNKQGLIFGEIQCTYIDDSIVESTSNGLKIDAMKLDPLARLGGDDYGTLGKTVTVPRPPYKPS